MTDPVKEYMTARDFIYDEKADLFSNKENTFWFSGMQARYLCLAELEGRRDELTPLSEHDNNCKTMYAFYGQAGPYKDPRGCFDYLCDCGALKAIDRTIELDRQIAVVKREA